VSASEVPAVEVAKLTKVYPTEGERVEALRGVDLVIRPGEFVAVMGPSGSGKTTLLNLIGGMDSPTSGTIRVGGQDLAQMNDDALTLLRRRRLGFVFQAFSLLDMLNAAENVALPLVIDGQPEGKAMKQAGEALDRVGLGQRRTHRPGELSGGEQQRVAIARALVTHPILLLVDEPTGNLDSTTGQAIMDLLRRLVDERHQTLLLVTHDARHAARADRLLRLRDGRVIEEQTLAPRRSPGPLLATKDEDWE
jgi:putative ABC transport system ATP-binding protein